MTGLLRTTVLVGTATLLATMPTLADNPAGTPDQPTVNYEMQERCGKDAAALFHQLFLDKVKIDGLIHSDATGREGDLEFQNHYSNKFNKCFMWTYTMLIYPARQYPVSVHRHHSRGLRHVSAHQSHVSVHHHNSPRLRHVSVHRYRVSVHRHHNGPLRHVSHVRRLQPALRLRTTHQADSTKEQMTVWDVNDNRLIADFLIMGQEGRDIHEPESRVAQCWVVKPEKLSTFDPLASSVYSMNTSLCFVPVDGNNPWLQWNALIKPYMQDSD